MPFSSRVFIRSAGATLSREHMSAKALSTRASRDACWYLESQIGIAVHPSRRPLRGLLRMRSNLLKHHQPHAEERATRASRSMGSKRLTYLTVNSSRTL